MTLVSMLFSGNTRLQQCSISDPAHVLKGDRGDYVALIQGALLMLDKAQISPNELSQQLYGQSTAKAVLDYKKKRNIINYAYQSSADDIVGRMTIKALDTEVASRERAGFNLLLGFGITAPSPKMVILSEGGDFGIWAAQVAAAHKPHVVIVPAPRKGTPEENVKAAKQAIAAANGGLMILSVGHGVCLNQDEGALDLAPDTVMRVTGRNSDNDPKKFVTIFYDFKPPSDHGINKLSDKEHDEKNPTPGGIERLRRWGIYQDLCNAFSSGNVAGVLLLTCRIGGATGFLKRLAIQWNKPVFAYKDQVMAAPRPNGRVRVMLARDKGRENQPPTTNTVFGEIFFPLSLTDMVSIAP